jgi:hypothetical protein
MHTITFSPAKTYTYKANFYPTFIDDIDVVHFIFEYYGYLTDVFSYEDEFVEELYYFYIDFDLTAEKTKLGIVEIGQNAERKYHKQYEDVIDMVEEFYENDITTFDRIKFKTSCLVGWRTPNIKSYHNFLKNAIALDYDDDATVKRLSDSIFKTW